MIKREVIEFLGKTPPFDLLSDEQKDLTAASTSVEFYPRGIKILTQNGPPCNALRVIKKGGVKVFMSDGREGEVVIDYRSEGDSFGFVSLLSGDRSRANIQALEDTVCYLIPKDSVVELMNGQPLVRDYFMKSFFGNFIDKTYGGMGTKDPAFGMSDKLLYTTPVRELIAREVVTCTSGAPIREAASIMSTQRVSSIIVLDEEDVPAGIVTDRDLRDKVVARGVPSDTEVDEIMSPPLIRVDGGESCFEALFRMIKYNIHHLLVVDGGNLAGVVTNHDFMMIQGTSPLSIVKNLSKIKSLDGFRPVAESLDRITSRMVRQGVAARHITKIISEVGEHILQRILELLVEKLGRPPAPFAIMLYGSQGRKERTYKTALDCAIVYDESGAAEAPVDADGYFRIFARELEEVLDSCGCPTLNKAPFGPGTTIYATPELWRRRVVESLKTGREEDVLRAGEFLDGRHLFGHAGLTAGLMDDLVREISAGRALIEQLTAVAAMNKSPIGFFKQFVVERSGEHKDELNLDEKGIQPIVGGIRALSIQHGIRETSTLDRLDALAGKRVLARSRRDLASAWEFLMQLQLQSQVDRLESMEKVDDFIDPGKLSHLERKTLKETFEIIVGLQETVARFFRQEVSA